MGITESKQPPSSPEKSNNTSSSLGFWDYLQKEVFESKTISGTLAKVLTSGCKILFVGNPGAGKSTLLNSLIQKYEFKSGASIGVGLTVALHPCLVDGIEFIDTPGLSDVRMRKQAAEEIRQALTRNGVYYLFFVVSLESGRVRPDDLTTMKLVLDALINVKSLSFGIIVNKVSPKVVELLEDINQFKEMVVTLNTGLPLTTTLIYFYPFEYNALDSSNILLPRNDSLEEFICRCTPVTIQSQFVDALNIDLFEQFKAEMEEETRKLKEDNAKLLQEIARLERENTERVRVLEEQIKLLLSKMSDGENAARPFDEETTPKSLEKSFKPSRNIHDCVRQGIGKDRWESEAWQKLYSAVKIHLNSINQEIFLLHKGLTLDMIGALTYYTSDVRVFGGKRDDSLFSILNPLMINSRDLNHVYDWKDYLWYAFEAYKILPKFNGTTFRGIDRALYNIDTYQSPGREITYNCFTSSTTNQKVLKEFLSTKNTGTWMIFKDTFSGVALNGISLFPYEREILFFPGTVFKVSDIVVSAETKEILGFDSKIDVIQFVESWKGQPYVALDTFE